MIDRKTETRMVGPSSGRVTYRNACRRSAPSIRAASLSSLGMPWSPASIRIMWKPKYFHEMITNIVIITNVASPSQSWTRTSSPDARDSAESTKACGWSSSRNMMPVTASDSTYGQEEQQPEHGPARGSAG